MKKITLFTVVLAMAAMTACNKTTATNNADAANDADATETVEVKVVPAVQADSVILLADDALFTPDAKVEVPTVLDFNATWCVPCKKLTPAFDASAEKYAEKVNFYSVDIDKCPNTAKAFNVQSVPTVVFISPDGTVNSYVGLGDFGVTEQVAPAQLTEVITNNMAEKIEAIIK